MRRSRFSGYAGPVVEGAITIEATITGASGSVDSDNTGAAELSSARGVALGYGSSQTYPPANGYGGGKPLFYKFTAPSNGTLTVITSAGPGSPVNTDTIMTAFTDPNLPDPSSLIDSNDDYTGLGFYSRLDIAVTSGMDYYIAVDGYNASAGNGWDAEDPAWNPSGAHSGSFTLTWSFV